MMHVHEWCVQHWLIKLYTVHCTNSMAFLFVTCETESCSSLFVNPDLLKARTIWGNTYRLPLTNIIKSPTMKKKIKGENNFLPTKIWSCRLGMDDLRMHKCCEHHAYVWSDHSVTFWIDQPLAHVPSIRGNLITCSNTRMQTIPHHLIWCGRRRPLIFPE
jgi:hypothetical protein